MFGYLFLVTAWFKQYFLCLSIASANNWQIVQKDLETSQKAYTDFKLIKYVVAW